MGLIILSSAIITLSGCFSALQFAELIDSLFCFCVHLILPKKNQPGFKCLKFTETISRAMIWCWETPLVLVLMPCFSQGHNFECSGNLSQHHFGHFASQCGFFLCELVAKNLCFCLFRVVIWATASTSHLLSGHRSAKAAPNTATPPNRWKRNWCFIFNLMQLSYYRQSFLHLLLFYVICDFCFVRSV